MPFERLGGGSVQDPIQLLKSLADAKVPFVLVGGMAGVLHGSSVVTEDVDLCISFTRETLEVLLPTLLPYKPRMNSPQYPPLPSTDPGYYVGWHNLYLVTDAGPVDFLGEISGVGKYPEVQKSSVEIDLSGFSCRVISADALIRAKKTVGREKDLRVAEELERIRGGGDQ